MTDALAESKRWFDLITQLRRRVVAGDDGREIPDMLSELRRQTRPVYEQLNLPCGVSPPGALVSHPLTANPFVSHGSRFVRHKRCLPAGLVPTRDHTSESRDPARRGFSL